MAVRGRGKEKNKEPKKKKRVARFTPKIFAEHTRR